MMIGTERFDPQAYLDPKLNGAPGGDFPSSVFKWMKLMMPADMEFKMAKSCTYFKTLYHEINVCDRIRGVTLKGHDFIYFQISAPFIPPKQRYILEGEFNIKWCDFPKLYGTNLGCFCSRVSLSCINTLNLEKTRISYDVIRKLVPTTLGKIYFRDSAIFDSNGQIMNADDLRRSFPQARIIYRHDMCPTSCDFCKGPSDPTKRRQTVISDFFIPRSKD